MFSMNVMRNSSFHMKAQYSKNNLYFWFQSTRTDPEIVQFLESCSNEGLKNICVSGVDLGIRNVAAAVIRTWNKEAESLHTHESNVVHKSKDYHYKAGKQHVQKVS